MHQILIPAKRADLLKDRGFLQKACRALDCRMEVRGGNELRIDGNALEEYNARIVMQAFARGFDFDVACRLLKDDSFFESINMKDALKNGEQVRRIKARVIGSNGKTKSYIQSVSGTEIAIYGDTISIIGSVEQIKIARAAIDILLEGGTHSKAYAVMEKTRRRMDEEGAKA